VHRLGERPGALRGVHRGAALEPAPATSTSHALGMSVSLIMLISVQQLTP